MVELGSSQCDSVDLCQCEAGNIVIRLQHLTGSTDTNCLRLFIFSEAPFGDNINFVRAETEGGSATYGCSGTVNGSRKFFCKGECKKEADILVETEENRAQSGRYSIEYTKGSAVEVYVTITQLQKSDSGRYKCGYGRPSSPDSSYWFSIFVGEGEFYIENHDKVYS